MIEKAETIEQQSSGWVFEHTIFLDVKTAKYKPLRGSSFIPLPDWIKLKVCCINVKNNDEECFKWAVLSSVFHKDINPKKSNEPSQYKKFSDKLNFNGISFPTKIDEIYLFEKNNNYAVNVFQIVKKDICPLRISNYHDRQFINLLLIENEGKNHYVWIKNFSRLMAVDSCHTKYIFIVLIVCLNLVVKIN